MQVKTFFLKIYDFLSKKKFLSISLLIILLLLCAFSAYRLHFKEDISEFLPGDELSKKYLSVYANSNNQDKIAIIFTPANDTVSLDSVIVAMDRFGEVFKLNDVDCNVKDINVRVDEQVYFDMLRFIEDNIPYFLCESDYCRMDSLLSSADYINRQLDIDKQMLMLPTGGVMKDMLRSDPLDLYSPVLQRLKSFQISDKYDIVDGCIFIKDSRQGLAFLSSPFGTSESANNKRLSDIIDKTISDVESEYEDVKISAIGAPLIAVSNAQQIKHDSMVSIIISLVLIFVLLIISFRRFSDILWIAISIAFGWIIAFGAFALFNDGISLIVIGIGSVMIGIAVNYPLHFLDRYKYTNNSRQTLSDIIAPLVIGNITTVGAFACLQFLDASAVRQLGLFGSLVLVGTILFVVLFLPLFVRPRKKEYYDQPSKIDRLFNFNIERRNWVFWIVVVITLVLGWFSTEISFDSNLQHINYMTEAQRADLQILTESLNQDESQRLYAVSEGSDISSALECNENLLDSIKNIKSDIYNVVSISGLGEFFPSELEQSKKLDRWSKFWTNHNDKVDDFCRQSAEAGFSENAFSPFVSAVKNDYQVQPSSYFDPIINNIGESYVFRDSASVKILNFIKVDGDAQKFKEDLRTKVSQSFVFDSSDVSGQLVSTLSDDFDFVGFVCSFIVFIFLWISFGRFELSVLSFLPLAVSWIWILGTMHIFGVQFNIVNIILATFIFGQGDDYTIFITEGLMHEYAYGQKMLTSYKKSVAISALIIFIGIGSLIIAKHPAMRSLAIVTIIGMFTVVLMAFYLPSYVFKVLTVKKGKKRNVPVTLHRLWLSTVAIHTFGDLALFAIRPIAFFILHFGKDTEKKKEKLHKLICRSTKFCITHIPGTTYTVNNIANEKFDKPAMIICNHQSYYDLMCLMSLSPKIVIMANDKAWNNPIFGPLIRSAEFYPASEGYEKHIERLKSLVERGYLVAVFPEGTRSEDSSIMRFHKGAFYLAEQLGLDILPVFIHGFGRVLAKKDFMVCKGSMYVEINERIKINDPAIGSDYREKTSYFHKHYLKHFSELRLQLESPEYWSDYVLHKYIYKGKSVERECRNKLKHLDELSLQTKAIDSSAKTIWILNSGQGEAAWLFALSRHDVDVYAFESDEMNYLLAINCSNIPKNLHFCKFVGNESFVDIPMADKCYLVQGSGESIYESCADNNVIRIKM